MTYTKSKLYIHKDAGYIVEMGQYTKHICPGIDKVGRYVKYGLHGKQIYLGYVIGPDYRYVGRL